MVEADGPMKFNPSGNAEPEEEVPTNPYPDKPVAEWDEESIRRFLDDIGEQMVVDLPNLQRVTGLHEQSFAQMRQNADILVRNNKGNFDENQIKFLEQVKVMERICISCKVALMWALLCQKRGLGTLPPQELTEDEKKAFEEEEAPAKSDIIHIPGQEK